MFSDSSAAPDHPVHLISQRFHKPFSTSVVDQARRGQPENQTPHTVNERASRRPTGTTTQVPRSTPKQKEFGSKKYRKHFHDRIIRKGPNFNIRRRNRLCMQSYNEGVSKSSIEYREHLDTNTLAHPLLNKGFATPLKPSAKEGTFKDGKESGIGKEDSRPTGSATKGIFGLPYYAQVKAQGRDAANTLVSSPTKPGISLSSRTMPLTEASLGSCCEKTKTKTKPSTDAQRVLRSESGRKSALEAMRES
ncbi:hypothetical protein EGW08_006818, partial [Elysia chlorotica]